MVGAVVVPEGHGCSYPGTDATIVFGPTYDENNSLTGTAGGEQLPPVQVNRDGTFRVQFEIPRAPQAHQGTGGGPIVAGRYQFTSKPDLFVVPFTVISR
jgi:hypothetical protein